MKTIKYHACITYKGNRELISISYDRLKFDKEDSKLSDLILPCYRLNHFRCVILSRCVLTTSEDLAWTPETRWFWSFWWSCKKIKRLVFSLQVQHYISDSSLHLLFKWTLYIKIWTSFSKKFHRYRQMMTKLFCIVLLELFCLQGKIL